MMQRVNDRIDGVPPWVLLIQLFIGFGWLRAATEKVLDGQWWSGRPILVFLDSHADSRVGWFDAAVELFIAPNVVLVASVVVVAQLMVGAALVGGRHTGPALAAGMALNLHFLLAGAVDPSIFYLVAQGAVGLWLLDTRETLRPGTLAALQTGTLAVIGSSLPFISTLHPQRVIEDPALVLVFFGALVLVAAESLQRRSARCRSGERSVDGVAEFST